MLPNGRKSTSKNDLLAQRVRANLRRAEAAAASLRKTSTRLLIASVTSSAGATLIAGITAARGPMVGEGIPGWRLACMAAAVFGFVSTLSTGINQRMKLSARLSKSMQLMGKLRSLDLMIATGSHSQNEIVEEYEELMKSHPELIT